MSRPDLTPLLDRHAELERSYRRKAAITAVAAIGLGLLLATTAGALWKLGIGLYIGWWAVEGLGKRALRTHRQLSSEARQAHNELVETETQLAVSRQRISATASLQGASQGLAVVDDVGGGELSLPRAGELSLPQD